MQQGLRQPETAAARLRARWAPQALVQHCPDLLTLPGLAALSAPAWHWSPVLRRRLRRRLPAPELTGLDPEAAYLLRLVHDQTHLPTPPLVPVPEDLALDEAALPDLHAQWLRTALWAPMRAGEGLLVQLLSKGLPQRCQRRELGHLVRRVLAQPATRAVALRLVACSLLGNYRHCRVRPTAWAWRQRWYASAGQHGLEPDDRLAAWLVEQPDLMHFAVREALVHQWRDDPVLRRHCAALCDVDALSALVTHALDGVRALCTGDTVDWDRFQAEAPARLQAAHEPYLRHCFQRERLSFLHEVLSTRLGAETAPGPAVCTALGDLVSRLPPLDRDQHTVTWLLRALVPLGGAREGARQLARLQHQFDHQRDGKRHFREALGRVAAAFPYTLGLLRHGARLWRIQQGVQLVHLPDHWLHAQTAWLSHWCRHADGGAPTVPVGPPRVQLEHEPPLLVPRELCEVYFCQVCDQVYSSVQRAEQRTRSHYQYGLANPRVDVLAAQLEAYCNNARRVGHLRCEDQPLTHVPVLGQMLVFRKECLLLCPRCGALAQLYTECYTVDGYLCARCTCAERSTQLRRAIEALWGYALPVRGAKAGEGPSCLLCARAPRQPDARLLRALREALQDAGRVPAEKRHALAAALQHRDWSKLSELVVYPAGVCLCQRHHHRGLAEHVAASTTPLSPRAAVEAAVREWHAQYRLDMRARFRRQDRQALSAMRRALRAGRA